MFRVSYLLLIAGVAADDGNVQFKTYATDLICGATDETHVAETTTTSLKDTTVIGLQNVAEGTDADQVTAANYAENTFAIGTCYKYASSGSFQYKRSKGKLDCNITRHDFTDTACATPAGTATVNIGAGCVDIDGTKQTKASCSVIHTAGTADFKAHGFTADTCAANVAEAESSGTCDDAASGTTEACTAHSNTAGGKTACEAQDDGLGSNAMCVWTAATTANARTDLFAVAATTEVANDVAGFTTESYDLNAYSFNTCYTQTGVADKSFKFTHGGCADTDGGLVSKVYATADCSGDSTDKTIKWGSHATAACEAGTGGSKWYKVGTVADAATCPTDPGAKFAAKHFSVVVALIAGVLVQLL